MAFLNRFLGGTVAEGDEQALQTIIDNLNHLLNTKKGFGSFVEGFGIRDMNEYSSREQLAAAIMEEVRSNIENFEPRLEFGSIALEESTDNFRISFKIECRLKESKKALLMEFNPVYNDFKVRNGQ